MTLNQDISRRKLLRALGLGGLSVVGDFKGGLASPWKWAEPSAAAVADEGMIFRTVRPEESHIRWIHDNAASEAHYLPESMASGCAFFDYDNDGWMDIFLVNTGPCDYFQPSSDRRPKNALYKNNRDGTFTDVTASAGLEGVAFGMGVAAGDYDGDGFTDLYVTAYGHNRSEERRVGKEC